MRLHLVSDAMRTRAQLAVTEAVLHRHHATLHAVAQHHGRPGAPAWGFEVNGVAAAQAQMCRVIRMQRHRVVRMNAAQAARAHAVRVLKRRFVADQLQRPLRLGVVGAHQAAIGKSRLLPARAARKPLAGHAALAGANVFVVQQHRLGEAVRGPVGRIQAFFLRHGHNDALRR